MSEKKVFPITRCWFETKDIVAEDYESAVKKFKKSPTKFDSIAEGHIESEAKTMVEDEPPRNMDGELICGRYISIREYGREKSRPCQNRVSKAFEPCHLHEDRDSTGLRERGESQ